MPDDLPLAPDPAPHGETVGPRRLDRHTDDPIEILRLAETWLHQSYAVVLATLVEIRTGAARPLGAQMVVRSDGLFSGQLSGGCLEASVAAEAMQAMAEGRDRDVLFGKGSPYFDIQLPCGGGVTVNLHVVRDAAPIAETVGRHEARQPSTLCYRREAQMLELGAHDEPRTVAGLDGYRRHYAPRTQVLVSGEGVEAETTRVLTRAAGYDLLRMSADARPERPIDGATAVVILHHDIEREIAVLQSALAARPFYIGALGSRATHVRRCERLADLGYDPSDLSRIKAPIGLIDRARDASTLAISILADIAASRPS